MNGLFEIVLKDPLQLEQQKREWRDGCWKIYCSIRQRSQLSVLCKIKEQRKKLRSIKVIIIMKLPLDLCNE